MTPPERKNTPLSRSVVLEASPRFELGIEVLQTFALPLGYDAVPLCYNIITKHSAFVNSICSLLEKVFYRVKKLRKTAVFSPSLFTKEFKFARIYTILILYEKI